MPGLVAAGAWSVYALLTRKRTTCATARWIARSVPGGRYGVLAFCSWFAVHLCRPLFPLPERRR